MKVESLKGMFWGDVGRELLSWVGLKEASRGIWVVLLLGIGGFALAEERTLVMVVMESGFVGGFMVPSVWFGDYFCFLGVFTLEFLFFIWVKKFDILQQIKNNENVLVSILKIVSTNSNIHVHFLFFIKSLIIFILKIILRKSKVNANFDLAN